jgi:hypothetical protein
VSKNTWRLNLQVFKTSAAREAIARENQDLFFIAQSDHFVHFLPSNDEEAEERPMKYLLTLAFWFFERHHHSIRFVAAFKDRNVIEFSSEGAAYSSPGLHVCSFAEIYL